MSNQKRMVVSYTRTTYEPNMELATAVQQGIIERFCKRKGLNIEQHYADEGYRNRHHMDELTTVKKIHLKTNGRDAHMYGAWEQLLSDIVDNKIKTIVVDIRQRLYDSTAQRDALETVCTQFNVSIVEVEKELDDRIEQPTVVYHYFTGSDKRNRILLDDIDEMYVYAIQVLGIKPEQIVLLCDSSCSQRERYNKIFQMNMLNAVIVHGLFHINKKTGACIRDVRKIYMLGGRLYSTKEHILIGSNREKIATRNLRVVVYNRNRTDNEKANYLKGVRLKSFIKTQTNWVVVGDITVERSGQEYRKLVAEKEFDIVVTDSAVDIGEYIGQLAKVLRKKPIYSLKEGFIYGQISEETM